MSDEHESTLSVSAVMDLLALVVPGESLNASQAHSVLTTESLTPHEVDILNGKVAAIRASFGRWRRREQELSAVLSGVRELAELRDVDKLLDRLVGRARELLAADVAYLTEYQGGHLKVRTTSGVVAVELRDLFVPAGTGLASKIVNTGRPQWTSAYQRTYDIPHEAAVDDAVAAEGLVSLLGVPLLAGNEILGALFAAYRTAYEFSPDEIALLGAFADHAAVVLQTARLLEEAQERAKEATEATAVLTSNLAAMERASLVHEDLTAVVVRGGSAKEIATTLSKALGRPIVVLDRDRFPVASAPSRDDEGGQPAKLSDDVTKAIARSRRTGLCMPVENSGAGFVVAVGSEDAFLGALLVGSGDLEFGAVELRTVERAAQIMALVTLKQDAVVTAENRVSDELVSDILNPRTSNHDALLQRARVRGIGLEGLRSVIVCAVAPEARRICLSALRRANPGSLMGEEDGLLVLMSVSDEPMKAAADAHKSAKAVANTGAVVVAGPLVTGLEDLGASFNTARHCAKLIANLGNTDTVVDSRAYKPYMAMFGSGDSDLDGFIDSVIGPVLRRDQARGGKLLATLSAFIDCHASPAHTARQLHVHVNTVLQRLERITSLLGPRWRDSESMFRISVAIRMRSISNME